jgi:inositol transport system substrate-binding protein
MYHSVERLDGINQLLEMRPDVQIIESLAADYDKAKGMAKMEDWLQKYPNADDFQAVAAANDMMALGALEAMKVAGRLEGVMVLGIDGLPVALDAIDAGEMTMSVFQNAPAQGAAALGALESLMAGNGLPEDIVVPFEVIDASNTADYR